MEESNNMTVGGEVSTPEVSSTESTTPDVSNESAPEVVESEESSEVLSAPEQSDRAKSRQHELASKLKAKDAELESLREQLGKQKPGDFLNEDTPSYEPSAEQEITFEDYQKHVMSTADQLVRQRMQQYIKESERIANFEKGVMTLETKYPELNPDSESYDEGMSDTVTKLYAKSSKTNPDLDIVEFVESVMNLRSTGVKKGQETASAALAKQETVTTPSNESPQRESSMDKLEQALKDGSISAEEAEKIIGLAQ